MSYCKIACVLVGSTVCITVTTHYYTVFIIKTKQCGYKRLHACMLPHSMMLGLPTYTIVYVYQQKHARALKKPWPSFE